MANFVYLKGKRSRTYMIQQGTRLGGVLSPRMAFSGFYLRSPMFADNLTMLSRKKSGWDKLLQTSWELAKNRNSDLISRKL